MVVVVRGQCRLPACFVAANARYLWSFWIIWICFVTIKCPNDHQFNVLTDNLARWESCGIPSTWHSPTTRQPGGSPRRNRHVRRRALSPGWRVVAPWEVDGMPHPTRLALPQQFSWLAIPETCLPRRGDGLVRSRCVC
jgi:hypothetical protein